jgi:hypothetical protein
VPASFEREYGCTEQEWLRWMPEAVHGHPWTQREEGRLGVAIGEGALVIDWQVLTPRVIALIRLPRMAVRFRFQAVEAPARNAFMKRFDLHLQRGGG